MGLIEIYHVVADYYPVDPDPVSGIHDQTGEVLEGMLVKLNAVGYAVLCDTAGELALGVAGDTRSASQSATPYAASLIINSAGSTRQTQNRVSDFYNETLASGKITVYTSGGKFATDQFEADVNANAPMDLLYTSANGRFTHVAGVGNSVGFVTEAVKAWDSGVPGVTDASGHSISLGNYVTFKLTI